MLSDRELECLRWISEGETDKAVAIRLRISARTVRYHLTNARTALRARNRVHAVVLALRAKLIS